MLPYVDLNRLSGGGPGIADINEFLLRQHENAQPLEFGPYLQQNTDLGGSLGMQRPFQPSVDQFPLDQFPEQFNSGGWRDLNPWYQEQVGMNPSIMQRLPYLDPQFSPPTTPTQPIAPGGIQPGQPPSPSGPIAPANPTIRPLGPSGGLDFPQFADLAPGGMRDLGIDPLTSPFALGGIQDLNRPFDRLPGMTGPYGGTNPQFFGGGINMPNWAQPQQPDTFSSRFNAVNEQPFMPLFPDPFAGRFNEVYNQPSYNTPNFDDWTRMADGASFPPSSITPAMGSVGGGSVPFDDPRGDFIGGEGGPRSSGPQIALMAPFPSVFDPRSHIQSPPSFGGGMGPGGIPFAPGLTPQGFTPPPPNFTSGPFQPNMLNPSWTSFGSPSFF